MVSRQAALTKVFGDPQKRAVKRLQKRVDGVNALSDKYQAMSKTQLRKQTAVLRERLSKKGTNLDDILPDAFAVVREMASRVIGERHYDVQLMGGMVLHDGNVAELKTGEGKTLMSTLAAYLNALEGKGVHIVTVNDYLAQRDAGWMGQVFDALDITTGVIINEASFVFDKDYDNEAHTDPRMRKLRPATRKEAYQTDITYGTNNEFGFDYLRDNMANEARLLVQRELNFAIVDEVDSILIDEARTPLIISAPAAENPDSYYQFARIASKLVPSDYVLDEKRRSVALTDEGVEKVEKMLGIKNLYTPDYVRSVYHIDQALRAQTLFKRDKDYVVTNGGEVIIVDEHTGRLKQGNRYNEGLHQAIEAKEGVPVLQESMTLATISFQNYFRLYHKLSGMTGTAYTEAEEFQQIYELDVVVVPPNKPLVRVDHPDLIFKTEKGKLKAVADAIKEYHKAGRPVLVGSGSISKNELIADWLDKEGIKYELLNAKNNEREAAIIEKAGEKGAITLATNIAGRGTDIKLGKGVRELGGLVVIGSERHESRRIDNQLRGRGGRQGDPGDSQFYVSTEDDLMRIFQGERIAALMERLGVDEETPIQNRAVSKTLEAAQKRVEGYNFDIRKQVVQYDNVINRHRKVVYTMRRKILDGDTIKPEIERLLTNKVVDLTQLPIKNNPRFVEEFTAVLPVDEQQLETIGGIKKDKQRREQALELARALYQAKEQELGEEAMRGVEREVYLQVLDTLWMQHLENMQHLRQGIQWRSVGQRDPLVEYRSESQKLFDSLQATLTEEVLRAVMHVHRTDAVVTQSSDDEYDTELTKLAEHAVERGVDEITGGELQRDKDFRDAKVKKGSAASDAARRKNATRKKRKSQRQNKRKSRS
ncbi:preprotein translocase subunit SecA [Candidatus Saccharibacteria bacterium]|nr:MAG: preprotein translocase subunit SecA [Candidatus Saccharibacteria bacterium]